MLDSATMMFLSAALPHPFYRCWSWRHVGCGGGGGGCDCALGLIQYRTVFVSWKERAKLGAWMCCLQDFAGGK